MNVAYEKLAGLDADRIKAALGPVLVAHAVECVELVWRTDRGGWVLEVTIEYGADDPRKSVTLETCAELARDLSAALDVADCIAQKYTLEVGSPGVERSLYTPRDYGRFAGQTARIKLKLPDAGQHVIFGTLRGLDAQGHVLVETERGELKSIELAGIQSGRLLFQWKGTVVGASAPARRAQKSTRGQKAQRSERSR
jgi:ribosome maturation factor RimP